MLAALEIQLSPLNMVLYYITSASGLARDIGSQTFEPIKYPTRAAEEGSPGNLQVLPCRKQ